MRPRTSCALLGYRLSQAICQEKAGETLLCASENIFFYPYQVNLIQLLISSQGSSACVGERGSTRLCHVSPSGPCSPFG